MIIPTLKCAPSMDPVAENAQQDPHCCWFLIGVTYLVREIIVMIKMLCQSDI